MTGAVCVVVPVRDEQETVGLALASLAAQTLPDEELEVLVLDGASTDGTRAECERWRSARRWRRFEILDNPAQTVPHALNAALATTTAAYFTRVDARTRLSPDYLERCRDRIGGEAALGVGGRLRAEADGVIAAGIAAAVTHPLGVGSGFRTIGAGVTETEVPHHPFAVWPTAFVRRAKGFDPSLVRNQDDEFSMRAARLGARTLVLGDISVEYRPRERLRGLAAQYFQYGLWKSAVGRRSGLFPSRSLAPVLPTAAWAAAALRSARGRPGAALTLAGAYLAAGAVASASRADADPFSTGVALATLHAAYGAGVVLGAARPQLTSTALGDGRVR